MHEMHALQANSQKFFVSPYAVGRSEYNSPNILYLYRNVSTLLRQLHMIGMARRALYIPEYVLLLWLQVEDQVARRLSAVTGDSAHQE